MERTEMFEKMPVKKACFLQILPAVASQMILLLYSLADTWFVGLLNDPAETAAVTVSYAPFMLLSVISNLFGVGGSGALSRALGRHSEKEAREISGLSLYLGFAAAVLSSVLFSFLRNPLLTLCGATEDTLEAASGYAMWVIALGGVPTVLGNILANLIRGEGSAKTASLGISLGGLLNIILDPLFVLPRFLGMGAAGAGLATAISNTFSMVFFFVYLIRRRNGTVVSLAFPGLKRIRVLLRDVVSIGFPSAVQIGLTVVAVSAQMRFVSRYDTRAVAGLGIVKKLDQLPLYFSIGCANGLMPLLAYNHAAGNSARRKEAFLTGTVVSVGFALVCLVVYELFAPKLAGIFIEDAETVAYAAGFLRRMVVAMPFMAFCYPMIIQFQAMKELKASLTASILRKGALDIPFLFLMDGLIPLYGCMWVQPIVDFISMLVCLAFYKSILSRENVGKIGG